MDKARKLAFDTLLRIHRDSAYSNLALDAELKTGALNAKDSAFAGALVYTTVERLLTVDYNLSLYLKDPLKKLKPEVLTALRIGASQILFMDKVPSSAAVNESVAIVKSIKSCSFASGLTNAVLRKISANGLKLPDKKNIIQYLSVFYSCPEWLVRMWSDSYGRENAEGILKASMGKQDTVIRVNTLKTNTEELVCVLSDECVEAEKSNLLSDALIIRNYGAVEKLKAFRDGLFHVQGASSQLCCEALAPQEGETVFDMCASPGGKTFTLSQMMNGTGRIFSFDLHEHRVGLIKSGAERLSLSNITAKVRDSSIYDEGLGKADRVLCDVPCSGLGVIGKKPEIKYKDREDIDKIADLQYDILCTSYKYLKKGGRLVYSTCSLNPYENEEVCKRFIEEHPDAKSVPVLQRIDKYETDSMISLMPHINGTDGFFISAFCKTE